MVTKPALGTTSPQITSASSLAAEEPYESRAIRTNLNGPITSLEAVVHNTGSEWERLVGSPVHGFNTSEFGSILASLDQTVGPALSTKFKNHLHSSDNHALSAQDRKSIEDGLVKAFNQNSPDITNVIRGNINPYLSEQAQHKSLAKALFKLSFYAQRDAFASIRNGRDIQILVTPPLRTPKEYAAEIMNLKLELLPKNPVPGTAIAWHADNILHELEHFTDQKTDFPKNGKNAYAVQLKETDSEHSSRVLLSPFKLKEYRSYRNAGRMIGAMLRAVYQLDRPGDNEMRHATSFALHNLDQIRTGAHTVFEERQDMTALVRKIRDRLGTDHDKDIFRITSIEDIQDIAEATQGLLDGAKKHIFASTPKPLPSGQRAIAEHFMNSLDVVGYTDEWENNSAPDQSREESTFDFDLY